MRVSSSFEGLKAFKYDETLATWAPENWRNWPHALISSDQGSDGVSALHGVMYFPKLQCNIDAFWDPAHGSWRDILQSIKDSGLYNFTLMTMVAINLPHGPEETDLRYRQLREVTGQFFRRFSHHTSDHFQAHAGQMLRDVRDELPDGDGDETTRLWEWLESECTFLPKGYKCNLNRFHSVLHDGHLLLKRWAVKLFMTEMAVLEMDMIGTKRFAEKVASWASSGNPDAPCQTGALGIDDKILRSCCQNNLVISMMYFSNDRNRQTLACIVETSASVKAWFTEMERSTRDVDSSSKWLALQCSGELVKSIGEIWQSLSSLRSLHRIGLDECNTTWLADLDFLQGKVIELDELASTQGLLASTLVACRMRRTLYITESYPIRLTAATRSDELNRALAKEFKKNLSVFREFAAVENKTDVMRSILDRSPFQLVSVKQLVNGMTFTDQEEGFSSDVLTELLIRSRSVLGTTIIEDVNNAQKNVRRKVAGKNRFRKPQTSMGAALHSEIVNKVHKFYPVLATSPQLRRTAVLKNEAFKVKTSNFSMKFKQLKGKKQKSAYFSPLAVNTGVPAADMAALRAASAQGDFKLLNNAWIGFVMTAKHSIVFCTGPPASEDTDWYIALHHMPDSSVLVWPARRIRCEGTDLSYIEPKSNVLRPVFLPLFTYEGITAYVYHWRSWLWQNWKVPNIVTAGASMSTRAFVRGDGSNVMALLAKNAFFDLGKADLERLSSFMGYDLDLRGTLFAACLTLVMHILDPISIEAALELLKKRVFRAERKIANSNEILHIDEAQACLDEADRESLRKQQRESVNHRLELERFREDYRGRSRESRGPMPKAKAKAGAYRRNGYEGPNRIPPPDQFAQHSMRRFMPPNSWLWVSRHSSSWNSRVQGHGQDSRSWRAMRNEAEAIKQVIQCAWRKYLVSGGLTVAECPIENLFDSPSDRIEEVDEANLSEEE